MKGETTMDKQTSGSKLIEKLKKKALEELEQRKLVDWEKILMPRIKIEIINLSDLQK